MLTWGFDPLVVDVVVDDGVGVTLASLAVSSTVYILGTSHAAPVLRTAEKGGDVVFARAGARARLRRGVWVDDGAAVGSAGDSRSDVAGEVVEGEFDTHCVGWLGGGDASRGFCDGCVI